MYGERIGFSFRRRKDFKLPGFCKPLFNAKLFLKKKEFLGNIILNLYSPVIVRNKDTFKIVLFVISEVRSLKRLQNGPAGIPYCPKVELKGGPAVAEFAFIFRKIIAFKGDFFFKILFL